MREFVLLDSGPLGQACRRPGTALADQCRLWVDALIARAVEVIVPEIAHYEVRRELKRRRDMPCAPMAPNGSRGDVTRWRRCRAFLSHLFQRRGAGMSALCR